MADSAEMVENQLNPIFTILKGADKFDFEDLSKWPVYLTYFKKFLEGNGMHSLPEKTRVDGLMLHLGLKGFEIIHASPLSEADKEKWDAVTDYLNHKFVPIKENVIQSRIKFNSRLQKEDERTVTFLAVLLELAKPCKFGQFYNDQIRDRILAGLLDREFSLSLAKNGELTLQSTIIELGLNEKKQGNFWDDNLIQKMIENPPERPISQSSYASVDKKGSFPLLVENELKESLWSIKSEPHSERRFWHRSPEISTNVKRRRCFSRNLTKRKFNRRRGRQNRRSQNFRRNIFSPEMPKKINNSMQNKVQPIPQSSGNNFDDRSYQGSQLSHN